MSSKGGKCQQDSTRRTMLRRKGLLAPYQYELNLKKAWEKAGLP